MKFSIKDLLSKCDQIRRKLEEVKVFQNSIVEKRRQDVLLLILFFYHLSSEEYSHAEKSSLIYRATAFENGEKPNKDNHTYHHWHNIFAIYRVSVQV